ncbi:MAG: hypothetical protein RMJ43_02070 [Chloroherpetonaceae bacterium]|nr:hypothetical protein [Chthonomonadaceae bacterium]MDW8206594.1 hypothetical protein [Chloroherpetonaceae bacterium]
MSLEAHAPTSRNMAASTVTLLRESPFDLVARAAFAIGACTRLTDPDRDGQPYSYAEFHTDPPIAFHAPWDYGDVAGRLLEALTLARIMTGTAPDERDEALARVLRRIQREDGLLAIPPDPWSHTAPVIELEWTARSALMAWTTRYLALDDLDARERAMRLINELHRRAVWEGPYAWYPTSYLPESGWTDRQPPIARQTAVLTGAQIIFPLARFAEATGYERALELALGLARFIRERSEAFQTDGRFNTTTHRYFHSLTGTIKGILKLGVMTGQEGWIDWARAAYEYACQWGTEFGFFPHSTGGRERWQGDICALKDMIEIALLLGLHRDSAYFADAERYGRNHLIECQILDYQWVENRVDAPFSRELWCANHPPEGITTDNVCQRTIGAFSTWSQINDGFDPVCPRLFLRSTGAGVRALYALWHHIAHREDEALRINLHFSRDTRRATVTSLIPREGGVDVLMKIHGVLAVRVPPGLTEADIQVTVNHQRPRQEILRNGYAWLEALQNGDVVSVRWPLQERAILYDWNDRRYTGYWRGDTLLRMNPHGKLMPLYTHPLEVIPAPPRVASGPVKEIHSF